MAKEKNMPDKKNMNCIDCLIFDSKFKLAVEISNYFESKN